MCDSCRNLFLSDNWRAIHPEWESRKDSMNDGAKAMAGGGRNGTDTVSKSSAGVRLTERELIERLGESRDREQSLREELDAYKRALRFARNFIELEQHARLTQDGNRLWLAKTRSFEKP